MVNKKLADWIKTEEAQGYTEQQLRQYLQKQGYKKNDIEDAINLVSHKPGMSDFFKKMLIPIVLFLVSFVFLFISFGDFKIFLGLFTLVFVLIHTFIYQRNMKNMFGPVFLTLLFSLTTTLAVTFIFYLLLAYAVIPLFGPMHMIFLTIFATLVIAVFIVLYSFISKYFLKTAFGEINQRAFFSFFSKADNFKSSLIKSTVIVCIGFLVLSLVSTSIIGISLVNSKYDQMSKQQDALRESKDISELKNELKSEELKNTKIVSEINQEIDLLDKEIAEWHTEPPKDWMESFSFFFSGKTYDDMVDNIMVTVNIGLELSRVRISVNVANEEYNFVKQNNITNLTNRINNIKNNINKLYSEYEASEPEGISAMALFNEPNSLLGKANLRIAEELKLYGAIKRIGEELPELRKEYIVNILDEDMQKMDIAESELSKSIRLRIIEEKIESELE